MHTAEVFYKPGLEDPAEIIQSLPPAPRTLHLAGRRLSIAWRLFVFILSIGCGGFIVYTLFKEYVINASLLSLVAAAAAFPVFVCFIPWWLFSSYKKSMSSYLYCKRVYENGIACIGTINTMTKLTGHDMETYHQNNKHAIHHGRIRIDYTFDVDNAVRVGTVTLSASSANYLNANDKVCVLYHPDDFSQNMLFPIPSNEFLEILR